MAEKSRSKHSSRSRTGLQIFFIYDVAYCRHEADDPKDAIIYFNPPNIPESQRCGLCCQLMGTVQFFSSCFVPPKLLNMQKGKFAIKKQNSYVMVLGGSKDMPDSVLLRQMKTLLGIYRFYHKSISSVEKACASRKEFLKKMRDIWDCCLQQSQHDGNALSLTFSAIPRIVINHNSKSVMKSSLELLHTCQKKLGVIAGTIIYKNRVLLSQLSADLTHRLMMIHPFQSDKFIPESANIKGRLPPGVRLLNVHLTPEELDEMLSLNKHNLRRLSSGSSKLKGKKRIELRNFFSDAPSSDELSTVTEESVETVNSGSRSVSDGCSDQDQTRLWCDSCDFEHDENDNIIDDDSGQSERSDESFADNAFSMLREVAKKSYLSSNDKLKNGAPLDLSREKFQPSRKCLRKSRSFVDSESVIETSEKSVDPRCHKGHVKSGSLHRSRSETTINITYRLNTKTPNDDVVSKSEVMSEDSSYYSNEPSPTLGRKQWKNEDNLTTADEQIQWQNLVKNALQTSDTKDEERNHVVPPKQPFRRKLSTIMGPQIPNLRHREKSFAHKDALAITGNNISEKISWSSSGYETAPSYDTDTEYKTIAQDLSCDQNNPQMLPNGKIVPLELGLLPATIKHGGESHGDDSCERTAYDYHVPIPFDNNLKMRDECEANVKRVTLFVQSHSEIVLILFLQEHTVNESFIQSLWRTGLSNLGDLSVEAHRSVENVSRKETGRSHKYLRFNSENHTLSGDSLPLNLNDSSDKTLSRVTQLIHEEFSAQQDLIDLTIALRDTMIHGHSGGNKETYYQQRRSMNISPQVSSKSSPEKPSHSKKRLESNFGTFLL